MRLFKEKRLQAGDKTEKEEPRMAKQTNQAAKHV